MQIYEIFHKPPQRKKVKEQTPVIRLPGAATGAVPNPMAQTMPGGMATSLRQTGTQAAPATAPNAGYAGVNYNVPTGVPQPAARPTPQSTNVPATVPGQGARQRINVDDVIDAPPKPGQQQTKKPQDTIDVPAREIPDPNKPRVGEPRVGSMSPEEIQAAMQALDQRQKRTIPAGQGVTAQQAKQQGTQSPEYQAAQAQLQQPATAQAPAQATAPAQAQTKPPAQQSAQTGKTGSILKALGSAATAAAGKYVQDKTGIDTSRAGSGTPYGAQQSQAAAAAAPVIAAQAQQQAGLWKQGLDQTMQQAGVQNPAQLPSQTRQQLAKSLDTQLISNLLRNRLGSDWKQLPRYVNQRQQAQAQAKEIVQRITAARNAILNLGQPLTDQQNLANWQALAQAAYDAMSLTQFNPATGFGKSQKPGQASTQAAAGQKPDPVQQAQTTLAQSGVNPTVLNQIQSVVGQLPSVRSNDPQVIAYLKALGFDV